VENTEERETENERRCEFEWAKMENGKKTLEMC
jgi:hypothetical protein